MKLGIKVNTKMLQVDEINQINFNFYNSINYIMYDKYK